MKNLIAKRVADELNEGDIVNLGIGLPTLVSKYVDDKNIVFQSENGMLGLETYNGEKNDNITDAGGSLASIKDGGMFFDSAFSFGVIRGGHVDVTVLGALEVDQEGNLANWIIPGKLVPGMGGAMDLVVGAKKVIIAMQHTNKGRKKILKKCTLPLTAAGHVDMLITEMCVFQFTSEGMELIELCNGYTLDDVKENTEAEFKIKIKST